MTKTDFDSLIDQAADLASRLCKLQSSPKLCARTFVARARLYAGISENRLSRIRAKIDSPAGGSAVRQFVRVLGAEFRKPTWVEPPPPLKHEKVGRIFGNEQLDAQLSSMGISLAAAIAAGAQASVERFKNDFGLVEDLDGYKRECESLRRDLAALHEKISVGFTASDLVIEHQGLESNHREAGLCRVSLRRAPNVIPGRPGWPVELVAHVAAERDAERLAAAEAKARKKERAKRKRDREDRASV